MMEQGEYMLFASDVCKRYGNKWVLGNIDLRVREGEFCTLVGPSGCGKSTFFRLVMGEERPTYGQLLVADEPVGFPGPDRVRVDQENSLIPGMTVLQNVMLGRRFIPKLPRYLWNWRNFRDEALEMLRRVHIDESAFNKYQHELSGGMIQRVAIAQALMMKPKILLMDEPFGSLDENTREQMQTFLLELWEKYGMTILFVTHSLTEALYLGTRLFVLSQYHADGKEQGACIVHDDHLSSGHNTRVKNSPEFVRKRKEIEMLGMNPKNLQAVAEFNLRHPDSIFEPMDPDFFRKEDMR